MKLEQALQHVIPFGPWPNRTIGWIAKFEPEGPAWLHSLFWKGKMSAEMRDALRLFFCHPKTEPWLRKRLAGQRYDPSSFLLPESGRCRVCDERLVPQTEMPPLCTHGLPRPYRQVAVCNECGWTTAVQIRAYVHCEICDEQPLFNQRANPSEGDCMLFPP